MITIAVFYSVYFFMCYFMKDPITPVGLFVPLIGAVTLMLLQYAARGSQMALYITKDEIGDKIKELDDEV